MQNNAMKPWLDSSWLGVSNQSYIENLYKIFLENPDSIDVEWRSVFQKLLNTNTEIQSNNSIEFSGCSRIKNKSLYYDFGFIESFKDKQVRVLQLINAFRIFGHKYANLDPLGLWKRESVAELELSFYDFDRSDFQEIFNVGSFSIGTERMKLKDLYDELNRIYCGSIGVEYMHLTSFEEKSWIQNRIESILLNSFFDKKEKINFLKDLIAAEGFEKYLGTRFPGAKRFSLEGADILILMLREIVRYSAKNKIQDVLLGMAHRGRLNVLVNLFGKSPKDLFDEFIGKCNKYSGSGDVKYHMGFSSDLEIEGFFLHLGLEFNPSHLEVINPVVMGSVRARLDHLGIPSNKILPITIHGDASISGQGVVQETLNMSKVSAYEIGGTIRIVINNQIGFTTSNQKDLRSTLYCTDIAKMLSAPIFHVNADDPEAGAFVVRLALDYRNTFKRDVFIDLVCYRRHGHNEADEPSVTQPLMYKKIKNHPTSYNIYADHLKQKEIISQNDIKKMVESYRVALDIGECVVKEYSKQGEKEIFKSLSFYQKLNKKNYNKKIEKDYLQKLAYRISYLPKTFQMQLGVDKIYRDRREMAAGNKLFDWGAAENLAYATLVDQAISVRLSGEDSARGTFFHRHAVVHNQVDGLTYSPLEHVRNGKGKFKVWNSVLSEEASLAFEYGYSIAEPGTLTIWEAQFGDFANGAQVVIDQFISSGEQKWGNMSGLVMLLPHGYEGQGPEHSSARLERYLQLCAEENMQVCIPSTPAQFFHMLRRQAFSDIRRPLIVMSPKSLLRHPLAVSSLDELSGGCFQVVISEIDSLDFEKVKRVVMCSGKIYYDLLEKRRKDKQCNVVILRIEQLYPFPDQVLREMLKRYSYVKDFVWCQEEPLNQGAWHFVQYYFRQILPSNVLFHYVARPASASPSVGCKFVHQKQQEDLLNEALSLH